MTRLPKWAAAMTAAIAMGLAGATARAEFALQTINDTPQNANDVLTGPGTTFTTNFKGINDAVVTVVAGTPNPTFNDTYPASPGNNPAYLSGFVGSPADGTGTGSPGVLTQLQTAAAGITYQFDFSAPLIAGDRILVSDIDFSETYTIQAFTESGGVYTPASLAGWTHQAFTGMTGVDPDGSWASFNPAGGGPNVGTLVAGTAGDLNSSLNVLTVDQSIARIVFTQTPGGGTAGIQILTDQQIVPEPSSFVLMGSGVAGFLGYGWRRRRAAKVVA